MHAAASQVDSLQLKSNVLAAYVAAGLSREIPELMVAMKISSKDGYEVGSRSSV